jgi:glycine amidinotransferase
MSKRYRFFEYLAYRNVVHKLWEADKDFKWKAAPKPSMNDDMYWEGYWKKFDGIDEKSDEEKHKLYHDWQYILTEKEMAFDAADIMKFGKDIFIQHSTLTNVKAIEWLRRELDGVVRVNALHFSNNKMPYHIGTVFVWCP